MFYLLLFTPFLTKGECKLSLNQQHGIYDNGKALPQVYREITDFITTGNRLYGNSQIAEPAFGFRRYASNANYTLNLLHSVRGVD